MARLYRGLLMVALVSLATSQKPPLKTMSPVKEIRIACGSEDMLISVYTKYTFNGMVYPRGLSKNSTCMAEYVGRSSPLQYRLSLRNCNTMGIQQDEGIEYFNTIVVQPHLKLVTNQGRGYHVRCKYQTRDQAADSQRLDATATAGSAASTALTPAAPRMPVCTMRIYSDNQDYKEKKQIAETVRIGDPLTLEIAIDEQEVYGIRVIDCLVRDGMGWGQQQLINDQGCPVDFEILGPLNYSETKTTASVRFEAHKFPYTASVYYQCNVRLCLKQAGDCDDVPPVCERGQNLRRRRRELQNATVTETDGDRVIEVFSGLYVEEGTEPGDPDQGDGPTKSRLDDDSVLCISPRTFAIAIAIVGLLLMVAVVVAIMVIISRRRRRKQLSQTGSSIYSGPYTNTAYSHSS